MPGGLESGFQNPFNRNKIADRRLVIIERSDNVCLPLTGNLAVAGKSCQHTFMPHVLAPSFEFFRAFAKVLAEAGQGRTETVWVSVRNTSPLEGVPENCADGSGIAPVRPSQAARLKLMRLTQCDLCCGEQRVVRSPQLFGQKIVNPLRYDRTDIFPTKK
jgi:hypothetical protein